MDEHKPDEFNIFPNISYGVNGSKEIYHLADLIYGKDEEISDSSVLYDKSFFHTDFYVGLSNFLMDKELSLEDSEEFEKMHFDFDEFYNIFIDRPIGVWNPDKVKNLSDIKKYLEYMLQ